MAESKKMEASGLVKLPLEWLVVVRTVVAMTRPVSLIFHEEA